jgi:hypothetical protein
MIDDKNITNSVGRMILFNMKSPLSTISCLLVI